MSKLLQDIEERTASAPTEPQRALLVALKAYHLPRFSRYDEARQLTIGLRKLYADGHEPPVLLWIMLAEAVLDICESLAGGAKDRIQRVVLLATAMRQTDVLEHALIWRALMEFNASDFERMAQSIKAALNGTARDQFLRARVCLLISMSHALCGRTAQAQHWSSAAHSAALAMGDRGTIEAILYNRAAMHIGWLRAQSCLRSVVDSEIAAAEAELSSAKNYFQITQHRSSARLLELCALRIDVLRGRYASAAERIGSFLTGGSYLRESFNPEVMRIEQLLCESFNGTPVAEAELNSSIEVVRFDELEVDERLVTAWMIVRLAEQQPNPALRPAAVSRYDLYLAAYQKTYSDLASSLEAFGSEPEALFSGTPLQ
jgi:hypothetical protein